MVATKTSIVWQLDCNSILVGSETRRPPSPEYVSRNALAGGYGSVDEFDREPIQWHGASKELIAIRGLSWLC